MSSATLEQDLEWRNRVLLIVEDPQTKEKLAAQYVPVALVRNGVTYIILYSMFATLLFVLLCAVLFKNGLSPQKRRLPFVWVLGFAMLGGLLGSTLNTVFWAYQLFGNESQDTMFRLWLSSTAMLYIVPLVTHFAIQLRLLSFYPTSLASRRKRIIISIIPSLLKVARLTTISITLSNAAKSYARNGFGYVVSRSANDTSNLFTLIFQLADTVYATVFLLWRYWRLGRRDSDLMQKKSHPALRWSKQIMFAIAFGYVLPTIYALALVLSKALDLSAVDMGFMLVANVYVQAFGAVLASLSSAYKWREDRFTDDLAPDNAVLPGMRNASDPFTAGTISARDARHVPALDSVMSESSTPTRPNFVTSRLPSLDARRRGANVLLTPASDGNPSGLSAIVTDGIGASSPSGIMGGDISPKSSGPCNNEHSPDSKRGASQAVEFPSAYGMHLPQTESRRSSDATLFAPSGGLDKADGPLRKGSISLADGKPISPPQSRPGSGGNGRMQRHGSGMSVPRDGSLLEEEESISSPTP
ncbi:Cytoplasmic dynein intermediate chain [Pseudozyma hubeiensis]|nr:Cytoplasmic dynein intermediate chain [Pseudozyma hubeiensis]